jgi:hypothetical protein
VPVFRSGREGEGLGRAADQAGEIRGSLSKTSRPAAERLKVIYMQGIPRNLTIPFKDLGTCYECSEKFKHGENKAKLEIYLDPWGTKPSIVRVHIGNDDGNGDCFDKLTDTSWSDFRFFECAHCERLIARQRADNGWRSHVKHIVGEEICVKCYQESRLEDGDPVAAFTGESLMGDFFNPSDISAHDWSLVPGYHGHFINSKKSSEKFCETALDLIRDGHKVLVDWGAQAYGGGEGYYSLYVKANMSAS